MDRRRFLKFLAVSPIGAGVLLGSSDGNATNETPDGFVYMTDEAREMGRRIEDIAARYDFRVLFSQRAEMFCATRYFIRTRRKLSRFEGGHIPCFGIIRSDGLAPWSLP